MSKYGDFGGRSHRPLQSLVHDVQCASGSHWSDATVQSSSRQSFCVWRNARRLYGSQWYTNKQTSMNLNRQQNVQNWGIMIQILMIRTVMADKTALTAIEWGAQNGENLGTIYNVQSCVFKGLIRISILVITCNTSHFWDKPIVTFSVFRVKKKKFIVLVYHC